MKQQALIGMTLCSGIGAPEKAAPWVDWRIAAEIEKFPRAVLQERFGYKTPDDHNQGDPLLWGDMTEVTPDLLRDHGIPLPDILVAGTPCQAFSIAGLRKGTNDDRGNLTLKFVETCHAIVDARPDGKLAVLWENVPGVLSDKGNAFGCFLGGIVGSDDACNIPSGGSWPSSGMVSGPRARAAWRVLDAQYFGVAQRRKRVFVVVDFGNRIDPAAVLFERKGLHGNTPPSREAGQGTAGTVTTRTCRSTGVQDATEGHLISTKKTWPAEIAPTLNAAFGDKQGLEDQHALNGAGMFVPAAFKASHYTRGKDGAPSSIAPPLSADADKGDQDTLIGPVAYRITGNNGAYSTGELIGSLTTGSDRSAQVLTVPPAVAFSIMPMNSGKDYKARQTDVAQPIMAGGPVGGNQGGDFISTVHAVRRLIPKECARLQGFPDDHTEITYNGKPAADGPQYKAYGNSMAVPCIAWIMWRMKISMEMLRVIARAA